MQKIILIFLLLVAQLAMGQKQQMSLDDAVMGRYTYLLPESLRGMAWFDDNTFTWEEEGKLMAEDAKSGKQKTMLTLEEVNSIPGLTGDNNLGSFAGYSWTEGGELLLKQGNRFIVLDIRNKAVSWQVKTRQGGTNHLISEAGKFVAYTIDDDLHVAFADGRQVQITNDGGNGIVNGQSVHRNEFGISNGIFLSPEGNFIAFYRMDESMVTDYPLVDFMTRVAEHKAVKYPMAGMKSHHVTVGIFDVTTGETRFLKTGEPADRFFTNIAWAPDEKSLYIAELNREQNHMKLNRYDVESGELAYTLFEETDEKYVEPLNPPVFSKVKPDEFYQLNRKDGWFHVYRYSVTGDLISQVTKGEWEVSRLLGFTDNERYLYVEATKENPLELHLYRVDTRSGKIVRLTDVEGVHRGIVSKNGSYVIDRFSAPDIPSRTDVISVNGRLKRTVHTADDPLRNHELGENKLVSIMSADGKTELTGRLILPVNFDPEKKYPVIVYVYGGPHSQLVDKSWHNAANWWQYYMASQGYIAFTMDNRGTNNRGRAFETSVHRQLGILETADQMKGIDYLKSLPYVDTDRMGVHGWSYGGFMTLNMMLRNPGVFKVAVAGGPVVDWSMYEIMYGERYMDMPDENKEGYEKTNMMNHIDNLDGKLLLIHGVQDDVVVMQHSMQLLRESVRLGKQVDFFAYPTHPHNVRGKDRVHLMEKISRYFMDYLETDEHTPEGAVSR